MEIKTTILPGANCPLTIGAVAKQFSVTPSLIRQYEMAGIVRPGRDSSGRRLFLPDDVRRIAEYRAVHGRKAR